MKVEYGKYQIQLVENEHDINLTSTLKNYCVCTNFCEAPGICHNQNIVKKHFLKRVTGNSLRTVLENIEKGMKERFNTSSSLFSCGSSSSSSSKRNNKINKNNKRHNVDVNLLDPDVNLTSTFMFPEGMVVT